jgi:hypothetical protein
MKIYLRQIEPGKNAFINTPLMILFSHHCRSAAEFAQLGTLGDTLLRL